MEARKFFGVFKDFILGKESKELANGRLAN